MYHQLSFIHSHLLLMLNRGRMGGCCACSYALLSYSWFPDEMTEVEGGFQPQ